MHTAIDFAKVFMKHGLDNVPNTYDGNMKLQKLLFFADMISLAKHSELLFDDAVLAFEHGCVVESVRLRYKNDYFNLRQESRIYQPRLSKEESDVVKLTEDIFGKLSANELSELSHTFKFWQDAFCCSDTNGYRNKTAAQIDVAAMKAEAPKIAEIIDAYTTNLNCPESEREVINGVTFFFAPEFNMDDETATILRDFAKNADETSYTLSRNNGKLVIM